MTEERVEPKPIDLGEYKFGFHDDVDPILSTGKGLNESGYSRVVCCEK